MTRIQRVIVNAVLFNVVWLVCVLGGSTVAVVAVTAALFFHQHFISGDPRELILILAITMLGVAVDSSLIATQVLLSPDNSVLPPLWLVSLWAIFATTLNHSTRWFQARLPVAFIAGGIAGPLTYITGTRLTDYDVGTPWPRAVALLAITWAVVFVVCMLAARQLSSRQQQA